MPSVSVSVTCPVHLHHTAWYVDVQKSIISLGWNQTAHVDDIALWLSYSRWVSLRRAARREHFIHAMDSFSPAKCLVNNLVMSCFFPFHDFDTSTWCVRHVMVRASCQGRGFVSTWCVRQMSAVLMDTVTLHGAALHGAALHGAALALYLIHGTLG